MHSTLQCIPWVLKVCWPGNDYEGKCHVARGGILKREMLMSSDLTATCSQLLEFVVYWVIRIGSFCFDMLFLQFWDASIPTAFHSTKSVFFFFVTLIRTHFVFVVSWTVSWAQCFTQATLRKFKWWIPSKKYFPFNSCTNHSSWLCFLPCKT